MTDENEKKQDANDVNAKAFGRHTRSRNRLKMITELVNTEHEYCINLQSLSTNYVEPLKDFDIITSEEYEALFSGFSKIYSCNSVFDNALQLQFKEWDNEQSIIGDHILKFISMFRSYEQYVMGHENRQSTLQTLLNEHTKFTKFCEEAENSSNSTTLQNLLLLPIQRGSRYEILLKQIISYTKSSHPDSDNLVNALQEISTINHSITKYMKNIADRELVRKIAASIKLSKSNIDLATPDRRFIKNGWLIKMGRTRTQRYLFFLFNDLLFYCKPDAIDDALPDMNKKISESPKNKQRDSQPQTPKKKLSNASNLSNQSNFSSIFEEEADINAARPRTFSHDKPSQISHDYNDTFDLSLLFGSRKARKSRSKLYDSHSSTSDEDDLNMRFLNTEIHNDVEIHYQQIPQLKVHNYLHIDGAFRVEEFRPTPQTYGNRAFEIYSLVKSFIVIARDEASKREWVTLLNQCAGQWKLKNGSGSSSRAIVSTPTTPTLTAVAPNRVYSATLYLPDSFSEICMQCNKNFNVTRRKKHCHHCGLLICSRCLVKKLPAFNAFNNQPMNVCDKCYSKHKHLFPDFAEAAALNDPKKKYKFRADVQKKKTEAKNKKKKMKFKITFGSISKTRSVDENEPVDHPVMSLEEDADVEEADADFDNGSETEERLELSMGSIPENNDFIDRELYKNQSHRDSQNLLPPTSFGQKLQTSNSENLVNLDHTIPAVAGHYPSKSESGFADDDDNSESDDDFNSMTPPISDGPLLFYEDTRPMSLSEQSRRHSLQILGPANISIDGTSKDSVSGPFTFPVVGVSMSPLVTNAITGNPYDFAVKHGHGQQGRHSTQNSLSNPPSPPPPQGVQHILESNNSMSILDEDGNAIRVNPNEIVSPKFLKSESVRSINKPLESIGEDLSSAEIESSAMDVDQFLSDTHVRNLSLHVIDQMDEFEHLDEYEQFGSAFMTSHKISIEPHAGSLRGYSPGCTPPPVSPRYFHQPKYRLHKGHKRKVSQKLDRFLLDRPNPEKMLKKGVLLSHPQEDYITDMQSSNAAQMKKVEERQEISKTLRRKLSGDFRPTIGDIIDRGIALVPSKTDDLDVDFANDSSSAENEMRNGSRSRDSDCKDQFDDNEKNDERFAFDRAETAKLLQEERKRKSKKVAVLLMERPTPADIIEKGIISAEFINRDIPVSPSSVEQLKRLHAEYAFQVSHQLLIKIKFQDLEMRRIRRQNILSYYDTYQFESNANTQNDERHIKQDYNLLLDSILKSVTSPNLQPDSNADTADPFITAVVSKSIANEDLSLEKEWMRNLRKRKLRLFVQQQQNDNIARIRDELKFQCDQLQQQMRLKNQITAVCELEKQVKHVREATITFTQKTCAEINRLRDIIKQLSVIANTYHSHEQKLKLKNKKNGFL